MRKRGRIWIAAGLLLLASALLLTAFNLLSAKRAEHLSVSAVESIKKETPEPPEAELPAYVLNPEMEMPTLEIDGRAYIGTLSIPDLGLELPVLSGWSYPELRVAPCRYRGSAYTDDLILCAHNYDSHFGRLRQLPCGAELRFTDAAGNEFCYRVTALELLQPTDIDEMELGNDALTLFTCTVGGRMRVTVRCERVYESHGGDSGIRDQGSGFRFSGQKRPQGFSLCGRFFYATMAKKYCPFSRFVRIIQGSGGYRQQSLPSTSP